MNVLSEVDYLSTVSGGGYIGRILERLARARGPVWRPSELAVPGCRSKISPAATRRAINSRHAGNRHLREFSRFLSPRLGFFETEMWHAVLAFLAGCFRRCSATLALVACGLIAWARLGAWFSRSARQRGRRHDRACRRLARRARTESVIDPHSLERRSRRSGGRRVQRGGPWPLLDTNSARDVARVDRVAVPPWPDAWLGPDGSTAVFIYPPLMIVALAAARRRRLRCRCGLSVAPFRPPPSQEEPRRGRPRRSLPSALLHRRAAAVRHRLGVKARKRASALERVVMRLLGLASSGRWSCCCGTSESTCRACTSGDLGRHDGARLGRDLRALRNWI